MGGVQAPRKRGGRFSANERTPSRKSSDDAQAAAASAASGASSERGMSAAVPWTITASMTRFEARWVSGALCAIVSTMAATWSVWSAAGTTSSTRPIRSARGASIASAVNSSRLACEGPTVATRRRVASGGRRGRDWPAAPRRWRHRRRCGGRRGRDGDTATSARAANRRDHRHRNRLDGLPGGVFGPVVTLGLAPHSAILKFGDVAACRERKVTGARRTTRADQVRRGRRRRHRALRGTSPPSWRCVGRGCRS